MSYVQFYILPYILIFTIHYSSCELDKWTKEQLKIMELGGNENARKFFKEKGWSATVAGKVRISSLRFHRICTLLFNFCYVD